MKRFILASGLLTALATAALAAPHATVAADHAAQTKPACSGSCGHGQCSVKGASAASAVAKAPVAKVATNGSACPVSDPSLCGPWCQRTQVSVSAKPAVKHNTIVVAAR